MIVKLTLQPLPVVFAFKWLTIFLNNSHDYVIYFEQLLTIIMKEKTNFLMF